MLMVRRLREKRHRIRLLWIVIALLIAAILYAYYRTPVNQNRVPYFVSEPIMDWANNTGYTYDVEAVDPEGESIYYDLFGDISELGFCTIDHYSGEITGKPHIIGDFSAMVSAFDGVMTGWQNWTLHIYTNTPVFDTEPIIQWQHGTDYLYAITVHDPDNEPLTWTLEGNCTNILSLDDLDGYSSNLSGFISSMGFWAVNISCFDGYTVTYQNFTLTALNTPPLIVTAPALKWTANVEYSYDADAIDFNGDNLSWAVTEKPDWMAVDLTTGECTGTPLIDGDYDVTLVVSDGWASDQQDWTLIVGSSGSHYTPDIISIDEWYIEKVEGGWNIVTPMGSFEWNAALSVATGSGVLLLSYKGHVFSQVYPRTFRAIGFVMVVVGMAYYAS